MRERTTTPSPQGEQRVRDPDAGDEQRVLSFLRSYEAFDPNGRGVAQYPTAAQIAAIKAHLVRLLAEVRDEERERVKRGCAWNAIPVPGAPNQERCGKFCMFSCGHDGPCFCEKHHGGEQ